MHNRNHISSAGAGRRALSAIPGLATVALGLAFTSLSAAPTGNGTITGQVVNADTGEPLRNAVVSIAGTTNSATAETGGFYTLLAVPAGAITLEVTYAGLENTSVTIQVPEGDLVLQDVSLKGRRVIAADGSSVAAAGDRLGSAKSLMEQRSSINTKKVISTDALGVVSEGNVGEFLKFMPGVSVDYVEADIRSIRIRGFDPKYSSVTMDGLPIATAGSSNISTNRVFEFEQLSISSISAVDLTKAPAASTFSNGMSGNTNLISKSAFDYSGRRLLLSVSGVMNEYYTDLGRSAYLDREERFQVRPNLSVEFADTYLKGKVGVIASVTQADSVTAQKAVTTAYRLNGDPTDNATELPRIVSFSYRDGPKLTLRRNYSARFDFKPSDVFSTWFRVDFNEYEARVRNRDLVLTTAAASDAAASYNSIVNGVNSTTVADGVPYSALSQTTVNGSASVSTSSFLKSGDTLSLASVSRYRLNNLTAEASLGYSKATNSYSDLADGYFNAVTASTTAPFSFRWDRSAVDSTGISVTQLTGADWRDQSLWRLSQTGATNYTITSTPNDAKDQRWTAKLDLRYPFTFLSLPMTARWGGAVTEALRDNVRISRSFRYVGADGVAGTADDAFSLYPSVATMDYAAGGNLDGLRFADNIQLADTYAAHPGWFVENTVGAASSALLNTVNLKEQINTLYLENVIKIGQKLEVTPGVRWEQTRNAGRSYRDIGRNAAMTAIGLSPTQADTAFTANPAVNLAYLNARYGTKLTGGDTYDNTLGYLHASYRLPKEFMLRASYHQSINRPDLANLVPSANLVGESVSSGATSVTASNPNLRPEQARSANVALEHYFASVGFVSVSVFRTDVNDIQTRETTTLGADGLDGDLRFAGLPVTRAVNGPKAHITGVELDYSHQLSFLPGPLAGLGVFTNATLLRFDRDTNFLGSPRKVVNLGVSYTYHRFNAGIRGNWTGTRLNSDTLTVTGTNAARREYTADRLMIDANVGYDVTKTISAFASVRNLFDEPSTTYLGQPDYVLRTVKLGAAYSVGVKATF